MRLPAFLGGFFRQFQLNQFINLIVCRFFVVELGMGQRHGRNREAKVDYSSWEPPQQTKKKTTLHICFGGESTLVEKQWFAEEISGRKRSPEFRADFHFGMEIHYKHQLIFDSVHCQLKGFSKLDGKIDGLFLMYKAWNEESFQKAQSLYDGLALYLGKNKWPVVVLVYIHEDRNKDNYHVFDFGAEKLEQNKENENQNKDPLLEKGIDWAEQQENVAFMEWGGGKKADRRYLERMRRAIMLDEAFYEKGITIKRAR